jgi:hypothetical protein
MIHKGNLEIRTQADADKYRGVTEVTGDLYIHSGAKLDAPALTSVGGYLSIHSSANLDAPALTSVGGDLSIYSSAKLDALTSVGGDLYINISAKLDAPALTSVGGYLYIHSSANLDAPALTSVGGDLSIYSSAKLDAPALTSVGGYLYIHSSAKLTAGKLYMGGYDKFTILDGIPCVVLSTKKQNGVSVLMCRRAQVKNHKVIGDKFYVARQGEHNAHGETIAEAVRELAFKTGDRDIEQFRNMPRTTRKTPKEWAFVYRMVTGACQFGTKDFMARQGKLKKSYTLTEILAKTEGAWGHETFAEVVTG